MTDFVVSMDGTRIACEIQGTGSREMIFVHGAGSDLHAHPELKLELSKDFRITSYDRRGRGDSEDTKPYDLMREVEDLRSVITCSATPPAVFGSSLGARIALELLRDPPDIASLVLFEPPAANHIDPIYSHRLSRIGDLISSGDLEGALVLHSRLLHNRSDAEIQSLRRDSDDWALRVRNMGITHREMLAVHDRNQFDPTDYRIPDFPVHLLVGTATLPFLRRSAELVGALPSVEVHRLDGMNHSAPRTDPGVIVAVIRRVLRP